MTINKELMSLHVAKVSAMTVDEFQDALDKAGLEGNSVIDSLVENLVEKKFEEVSH